MTETPIVTVQLYNKMAVAPSTHVLSVNSTPIHYIPFTVDGVSHVTDWSGTLNEGQYTVIMPASFVSDGVTYNFIKWENGSTNRTRTVNLTVDITITATYATYTPPITGAGASTFGEQWGFWVWSASDKRWYKCGLPTE